MRSRITYITIALAASALALPLATHAASIPFFGPIIDPGLQTCALGWGAVLLVVNNLILFALTILIVFIAPLVIAYAGFLLVVNAVNPHGKEEARKMIANLVIGLVIALASWLIVDMIMAVLYNGTFGSWSQIINSGGGPTCLNISTQFKQAPTAPAQPGGGLIIQPGGNKPDGVFIYQPGIQAQAAAASPALNSFLSCMAKIVPGNVGVISSISDSQITSGAKTFAACAAGGKSVGCAHAAGSCHYGGSGSCVGQSYAVDFGDEFNSATLTLAAQTCERTAFILNEGDHLHVSVGASCGCQ